MSLPVPKTYKLYVGGKFPRSESGRSYQPDGNRGLNVARASRKDLRDAVVAARAAASGWAGSTAYLRGQILYRLAEMLESRRSAMQDELVLGGTGKAAATKELDTAIALVVWHAGLCDKVQALLGSQNAVQGPFFNFTTVEPCGVVGVLGRETPALVGTLALVLPLLASGNTVVALVGEQAPFAGLVLGEACASSDLPGGVLNLLSGSRSELAPQFAAHRDLDGLLIAGAPDAALSAAAADNVKRVRYCDLPDAAWQRAESLCQLSFVEPFVEAKTLWHPIAP